MQVRSFLVNANCGKTERYCHMRAGVIKTSWAARNSQYWWAMNTSDMAIPEWLHPVFSSLVRCISSPVPA